MSVHLSTSTRLSLDRSWTGGVGSGVGGTLSIADENIPSNDDDEFAKFRFARDKNEASRLVPRLGRLSPELFFRDDKCEGESCGVDGFVDGVRA